jgi:hypothetical protein
MGSCCCKPKEDDDDNDETRRLLDENRTSQSQLQSSQSIGNLNARSSSQATIIVEQKNMQQNQINKESDEMIKQVLSEIIQVSTIDQQITRTNEIGPMNGDVTIRGLVQNGNNKQLSLPDGVIAPLTVLSAQTPFLADIKMINSFASMANAAINNYTLKIPDNVAFNFSSIA